MSSIPYILYRFTCPRCGESLLDELPQSLSCYQFSCDYCDEPLVMRWNEDACEECNDKLFCLAASYVLNCQMVSHKYREDYSKYDQKVALNKYMRSQ